MCDNTLHICMFITFLQLFIADYSTWNIINKFINLLLALDFINYVICIVKVNSKAFVIVPRTS
jgi:hypothetical protein